MKKTLLTLLVALFAIVLVACNPNENTDPDEIRDVSLTLWASELEETLSEELIASFIEHYKDEANLTVSYGPLSEAQAADNVLADLEAAADVFVFASDQFERLMNAGALQEVHENPEAIIAANGGAESGSILAGSKDGKLYAYPLSADNGYFLYYDSTVYSEEDVKTVDGILARAKENGSKFTFNINNGWYLYGFFGGAGLPIEYDGELNSVDWNNQVGLNVAKAIIELQAHEAFINMTDAEFAAGVEKGEISAGVNGTWNSEAVEEAFGEGYAATKLPTYTLNGEQVQMSSFAGYKLAGVNQTTSEPYWSMKLAEWITSEQSQIRRFETNGVGPSNANAAQSDEVQTNPAIAAIAEQGAFAVVENIGAPYWAPAESFGNQIVDGTLSKNSTDAQIQESLDLMVEGIESAPVE